MKSKRFLAVVLAALMLFTAVISTGCAKKDNNDENEKSGIITLNMFVITEEETSESAAKEVQMAINEITVPQYKMLVKINYVTEDEYWDVVDKAEEDTISYVAEAKEKAEEKEETPEEAKDEVVEGAEGTEGAEGEAVEPEEKKSISEMSFNEAIDYVFDIEDVELEKPQIDVLVVNDYAKFLEMVEDERLAEIDIKYDRKAITKYIHPTILTTTLVNKKTYGIPTNFAINGEYEFFVFNKNLLDKYGYTVADLKDLEDMGEYLELIKNKEPGYYPISEIPEFAGAEIYDNILFAQSKLESVSTSSFPIYLNNTAYMNYLKTIASYREKGYVADYDGVKNAKYAVELVKSTDLIEHEWTEDGITYQAYLYDIPRVTSEDAFKAAMCVSAYSLNKAKAAELIELFNIDAELSNMLQYGIEGKHYRVEDGIVDFIETDAENVYRMNNLYTGNTYIKYATPENADYVEKAKSSNLSTAPSAFFGYTPAFDNVADESVFLCVKTFSEEALSRMASGEMTVDEVFNIASRQLNALGCVWDASGANLQGVFGNISRTQGTAAAQYTSSFVLSEAAEVYNDVYKTAEEVAAEIAAEEAKKAEEEAAKLAAEEAALAARIEAENKANEEPFELEEEVAEGEAEAETETGAEEVTE